MPPRARKPSAKAEAAAALRAEEEEGLLGSGSEDGSEDYQPKKKKPAAKQPAKRKAPAAAADDDESSGSESDDDGGGGGSGRKKKPAAASKKKPAASPKKKKAHVDKALPGDEPKSRTLEQSTGYWLDPSLPLMWTTVGSDGTVGAKVEPRKKVAAFDLDGTLVFTKGELAGGSTYPRFEDDWVLFNSTVPEVVRRYHDEGFEIAIISNQGGVQKKLAGKMAQMVKARGVAIATELGVPCSVLMCPSRGECAYRKPKTGMWDFFETEVRGEGAPKIDRAASCYVGDAAGRPEDHAGKGADSDRVFAETVGLRFMTPEECFGPQGAPKGKVAVSPQAMKEGRATVAAAAAGDDEAAGPNGPLLAALSGISAKIFALVKSKPDCFPGADGASKWRFKAVAYNKAAASIAAKFADTQITLDNIKAVAKLPNVGPSTIEKLKEFLNSGRIALMDELEGFEAAGPAAVGAVPAHVQQQQQAAAAFM